MYNIKSKLNVKSRKRKKNDGNVHLKWQLQLASVVCFYLPTTSMLQNLHYNLFFYWRDIENKKLFLSLEIQLLFSSTISSRHCLPFLFCMIKKTQFQIPQFTNVVFSVNIYRFILRMEEKNLRTISNFYM